MIINVEVNVVKISELCFIHVNDGNLIYEL